MSRVDVVVQEAISSSAVLALVLLLMISMVRMVIARLPYSVTLLQTS
jgi:hypothetical protein